MTLSQLCAMRLRGQQPADMVMLSLVGRIVVPNPVIDVTREDSPDWRALAGLDVQIVHAGQVNRVVNLCNEIVQIPIRSLSCWNALSMQTILVEENGRRCLMEVPCN